jgi:hypothetical protein
MRSSAHTFRSRPVEQQDPIHIVLKKPSYPVGHGLARYLTKHGRRNGIPIAYEDLLRHDGLMAQRGPDGNETLWTTVMPRPSEMADLHERLVELYRILVGDGKPLPYLCVDSIDFCAYGNSQPFRIKILNRINDNHDYFYIKISDSSRVYGLELEHLLSPNRISYLVDGPTLVEEHIIGVPGDSFIVAPQLYGGQLNEVRLSKEFVKFNERCFVRLLGDMRAYNFVVDVIHDLDQVQYRIRSIDFDQQSHEGRARIYLPQFYKENRLPARHGRRPAGFFYRWSRGFPGPGCLLGKPTCIMTKRPHLLILAALFASALAAQPADTEPATLFGSDKDYRNGGWGGPMVAFTEVLDQPALLTGLRGGWMIDHRFTLGLAGYGLVTNAPNPAYDQWLLEEGESLRHPSQFRMGYGGLLLEPVIGYKSPIHVTLPILIGAGGCTYQTYLPRPFRDSTHRVDRFERGEAFFVVEPGWSWS